MLDGALWQLKQIPLTQQGGHMEGQGTHLQVLGTPQEITWTCSDWTCSFGLFGPCPVLLMRMLGFFRDRRASRAVQEVGSASGPAAHLHGALPMRKLAITHLISVLHVVGSFSYRETGRINTLEGKCKTLFCIKSAASGNTSLSMSPDKVQSLMSLTHLKNILCCASH